jgi:hypothetical protein
VQRDVMNFADRFAGSMAGVYDELAAAATTPAARNGALERKIGNCSAAYVNASASNPIVGLIDMVVMVSLLRRASAEPWFADLVGADGAARVTRALESHEADINAVAARYLTENQIDELGKAINRWHDGHAGQHYVATVRIADFPEARAPPAADARGGASVFALIFADPLAGLDPAMREVVHSRESAERMFYYAQRMPTLLAWQSELVAGRVTDLPRVRQLAGPATRFSDFADTAAAFTEQFRRLPQTLADERRQTADLVAEKVAAERNAALKQAGEIVAVQRDAAVNQLAAAVAVERDAAINQLAGRTANRVSVLAGAVVALGVLLVAVAVLFVRRIAPPGRLMAAARIARSAAAAAGGRIPRGSGFEPVRRTIAEGGAEAGATEPESGSAKTK